MAIHASISPTTSNAGYAKPSPPGASLLAPTSDPQHSCAVIPPSSSPSRNGYHALFAPQTGPGARELYLQVHPSHNSPCLIVMHANHFATLAHALAPHSWHGMGPFPPPSRILSKQTIWMNLSTMTTTTRYHFCFDYSPPTLCCGWFLPLPHADNVLAHPLPR